MSTIHNLHADEWNKVYNVQCKDLMNWNNVHGKFYVHRTAASLGIGFVDAVHRGDGTCGQGCPDVFRSLCRNGKCATPSCKDARPHCQADTTAGLQARMLCPVTCGCSDPETPLVLSGAGYGCGPSCRKNQEYTRVLNQMPCRDTEPGSYKMCSYAEQFFDLSQSTIAYPKPQAKRFQELLMQGCQRLPLTVLDLACKSKKLQSLSLLCPVSCSCGIEKDLECPTTCMLPKDDGKGEGEAEGDASKPLM